MYIKEEKDRQHRRCIRLSDEDWKIFKEHKLLNVVRDMIKNIKSKTATFKKNKVD